MRINSQNPNPYDGEMRATRRQMFTFLAVKAAIIAGFGGYVIHHVTTHNESKEPSRQSNQGSVREKEERNFFCGSNIAWITALGSFFSYGVLRHLRQGRLAFRGELTNPPPPSASQESQHPLE